MIDVFDGHNDVLSRLIKYEDTDPIRGFLDGDGQGQIDLPRAREGGMIGGLFATFYRKGSHDPVTGKALEQPPTADMQSARDSVIHQVSMLQRLLKAAPDDLALCLTAADINAARSRGALAIVLHLEGAEAIDTDFHMLDVLHAAGLRSLGLVWSRENAFGHGVPFRYPSSPDTGPGLTPAGIELVKECNRRKILVDCSHITEKGFWDTARTTTAPLVATHSNVHSITASTRNLTDRQLDAIRDSDGMVGVNFAVSFLRGDGQKITDTSLDWIVRHIDGLVERVGETRVGLGSDFDGAKVPDTLRDVSGLQRIFDALRTAGYDDAMLRRIGHENWLALIERTIG